MAGLITKRYAETDSREVANKTFPEVFKESLKEYERICRGYF